jgi:hypothetical protein
MPDNKALDAEPPIASFLKSRLIGGGPVNAAVTPLMIGAKIMRPCGQCGAPIENHDDSCETCVTAMPSRSNRTTDKGPRRTEPRDPASTEYRDEEPLVLKLTFFCGILVARTIVIVCGVTFACWLFVGNSLPSRQSATIGFGISVAYAAIDVLVHWLNNISQRNRGVTK